jgi:AraC-like DNA-binding protein
MNIAQIIGNKFNWKNTSQHRMLNSNPHEGILASGYVRKNKKNGALIHLTTNDYHGVLVIDGHGYYEDANGKIPVKTGDFIQRFPGNTHSTFPEDDRWTELYIVIGKTLYENLVNLGVLNQSSPVIHPGIDFETIQSFLSFHEQLGYSDRLELPLVIPKIIDYLARLTYSDRVSQYSSDEKNILSVATEYIHENIDTRISIEDVALKVNMGYEKFRKLFTKHYNISPGNYMIQHRIYLAQRLLSNSELSIKEVSIKLGYVDTYTFSKQFKKITGRSPSDFKSLFLQ